MSQPLKLLGLAEQPKLKARARPSRPSAVLKLPSEPYITHLTLLQQGNGSGAPLLVAASSDGALRAHDALTLAPLAQAAWAHSTLGDISAVTPAKHAGATALVAGKNGVVALWDPRVNNEQPALTLKGPSRAPYISLASAADGYSVAVGTELKGYEAMVDLWDLRSPAQPRLTYTESHSDDITSLTFHHGLHSHLLLSGSTDGLLCVLDTRQADEDDAVLGVSNTGASVARAGWGATGRNGASRREGAAAAGGMHVDGQEGEYELEVKEERAKGMGGFWAVSDMQTLSTWNEDFDAVLPSTDARDVRCFEWQTDYVIDAFDAPTLAFGDDLQQQGLSMFVGTQNGRVALLQVDAEPEPQQASAWRLVSMLPDSMAGTGGHSDIVRAVAWDAASRNLYTGGEDAQLSVWDMTASGASSFPAGAEFGVPTPLSAAQVEPQDVGMESPGAARRGAKLSSRHTPY